MKLILFGFVFILLSVNANAEPECDYSVGLLLDSNQFGPEEFKFKMMASRVDGPSTNITAQITIASNGSIIKNYKPWANSPISKQKTSNEYSPNLKDGVYELRAEISTLCSDSIGENNIDERIVSIRPSNDFREIVIAKEAADNTQKPGPILKSGKPDKIQNEITENKNNLTEEIKNVQPENKKTNQIIYESSNEKAKDLILILLLAISIILNAILIWKR